MGCICLLFSECCMTDDVKLYCLVMHPYVLSTCGDCVLFMFATIDPPSEFEEGYGGQTFAGEEQEEPETTGKPPLALGYFTPIMLAYALVVKTALFPQ